MHGVELIPLSSVNSYSIRDILREEQAAWISDLKWDYREPQQIVSEMMDRAELPGHVALIEGQPAGYSYYLCRQDQGLLGNCFVTARLCGQGLEERLLRANIESIRRNPRISRIEAQLVDLRNSRPGRFLERLGFRSFERCFLLRGVEPCGLMPLSDELSLEKWNDAALEPAAKLTALAYQGTSDWEMASHYRSPSDCLDFLCGVVFRPGCGLLLREASFCVWAHGRGSLAGFILTSVVSTKNGHVPQVAVAPDYQGQGLGTVLLGRAIQALFEMGYLSVSLSVTSANQRALSLYRKLGFQPLFLFDAFAWDNVRA